MKTVGMGSEKKSVKSNSADSKLKKENKELLTKVDNLTAENKKLSDKNAELTAKIAELEAAQK